MILQTMVSKHLKSYVSVFVIALVLRLLLIYEISGNPTFYTPIVDASSYSDAIARSLAAGKPIDDSFFWQASFIRLSLHLCTWSAIHPYFLPGSSSRFWEQSPVCSPANWARKCLITGQGFLQAFSRLHTDP